MKSILSICAVVLLCTVAAGSASAVVAPKVSYSDPSWSRDGKHLAVVGRKPSGETDLYVLSLRGSLRRLYVGPFVRTPTWSPDDRRIAFATASGVSVVNTGGGAARLVTRGGWTPSWSPGGNKIAFGWSPEISGSRIYVVNPDGSGRRVVAQPDAYHSFLSPTWSPDGQRLAFLVGMAPDSATVTPILGVIRDYGGDTRTLLPNRDAEQPSWSPNGQMIAFADLNKRIAVADLRTNHVTRLRLGNSPTWSPDGARIAFARSGHIWVMNANGSNLSPVTK